MISSIFERHKKIAFEFSGGKDSLAIAVMLREYRDLVTVYWCNTGDADPETVQTVEQLKNYYPNVVVVNTDVFSFREQFGDPSPVVPINSEKQIISDQLCCMHNIMLPLHKRVVDDGNTCIIRGQKDADRHKGKLHHGDVYEGIEYVYPLECVTDQDVLAYLEREGVPVPKVYEYSNHGTDCLHCTGWWVHKHRKYLKDVYPMVFRSVDVARQKIKAAVLLELDHVDN